MVGSNWDVHGVMSIPGTLFTSAPHVFNFIVNSHSQRVFHLARADCSVIIAMMGRDIVLEIVILSPL